MESHHCAKCNLDDALFVLCDGCNKFYCNEHRLDHLCKEVKQKIDLQVKPLGKCIVPNCKERMLFLECSKCWSPTCVKHRIDHECDSEAPLAGFIKNLKI